MSVDLDLDRSVVLQFGDQDVLLGWDKGQQNGFCVGALDGDQRGLSGGVLDGDVESAFFSGTGTISQGRSDYLGVARVGDHEVLVLSATVGDEVVDDAAVGVADQRVLGLANGDRRQLPDQGVVEERGRVRAADPDFAHVGEVEQARGVADSVVLCEFRFVFEGHLPAAEVREGGAGFFVLLVESGVILSH